MPAKNTAEMSTKRSLLAASLLCAALLPAGPARAFDGPGCGSRSYSKTSSCTFALRGSPIIIQGDSNAPGTASVHVYVTLSGYPELGALMECMGSAAGFAKCDKGLPDETTDLNLPPQVSTVYLICHVDGSGAGEYWCQSGK